MLQEVFGKMYLINLPERTDRLSIALQQCQRAGLTEVELFPALKFQDRAGFRNAGARGCFHSHLECLRCAESEKSNVLLLEDDLDLCSQFSCLQSFLTRVAQEESWDFLYFGHEGTGDVPRASGVLTSNLVALKEWNREILTTHFYGVNYRILRPLIDHLEALAVGPEGNCRSGPMDVDGAYNIFREDNPRVRCLITIPKLGWQRSSRSDISPRLFDQVKLLRPAIEILRHVRRGWR